MTTDTSSSIHHDLVAEASQACSCFPPSAEIEHLQCQATYREYEATSAAALERLAGLFKPKTNSEVATMVIYILDAIRDYIDT